MKTKICSLLLLFYSTLLLADKFEADASYNVCFTPAQSCTPLIVANLNNAKNQILVEAYSFTSVPIAKALLQASKRGVDVKVILDKSQYRAHGFSAAKLLTDYHIPVWIDYQPSIAHNKVMIIDNKIVITGSFNFTRAAEEKNAENVIVIKDALLAKRYAANWNQRLTVSKHLSDYFSPFTDQ